LHDEQTLIGLRKIAFASVFRLIFPMSLCFPKREPELTENGKFCSFSANGKWKWQTSVCLLQTEKENGSLFSLVGK
jgi:hypothetical protein